MHMVKGSNDILCIQEIPKHKTLELKIMIYIIWSKKILSNDT